VNQPEDPWIGSVEALGSFIHTQRKLAKLSLRELAALSDLSNAYLSQLERGLHQPSMRVIHSIARGLNVSAETLLKQAGLLDQDPAEHRPSDSAEQAIRSDPRLSQAQKDTLLAAYQSFAQERGPEI
jgi:transcriptional regulator with XRE-family HTH domain